jgi:transcriptional regulator with XRE-family HTH domain
MDLRRLRWTQQEVAEYLGFSQSWVSAVERERGYDDELDVRTRERRHPNTKG